jgi:hypothetical protein
LKFGALTLAYYGWSTNKTSFQIKGGPEALATGLEESTDYRLPELQTSDPAPPRLSELRRLRQIT